jgi:two-component system cell cycle response regulator
LKKIILPGLIFYVISSGLGWFLKPDPSNLLRTFWLAGYVVLFLAVSYFSFFSKKRLNFFPFIILGVILLNFFVQISGGANSSLWPAYFLFSVLVAVFAPIRQSYGTIFLILGIESANLFLSGQWKPEQWPLYAGFAVSLTILSLVIAHIMHRTRKEVALARDAHERLIAKADAYDPFDDADKIESLVTRQTANVSAALQREITFNGLLDMISEFVPAHTYALFLRERRDQVELFTLRAIKSESESQFLMPVGTALDRGKGKGLINICAEQKQPQYMSDMVLPLKKLGYYVEEATVPVRSFLVLPILHQDRIIGVLAVDSLERGAFSFETQDMLTRFTPFFIQIIEKIQLSLELDVKVKHFAALNKMSIDLNSSLQISEILDKVTARIKTVVPYDHCAFVLYDENEGKISLQALRGYKFNGEDRFFDWDENIDKNQQKTINKEKESAILYHLYTQWRDRGINTYYMADFGGRGKDIGLFPLKFKELQQPLRSLYGQLLASKGKFIGAFFLDSQKAHAFNEYHRNFLDTLLNQVSMVMDNAILHQQISNLARTDGLTGLLNHRTFMEKLAEEYRRIDRDPRPFSILLIDIDKFKNVNDTYGHPVGDLALKSVAQMLEETGRSSDFVARYGGEEFAIGMVDTNIKGAKQMAERIRKIMEKTVAVRAGNKDLMVTLSVGVSSYPEDTKNTAELVTMADNALYQAKRSGRNRICLHRDVYTVDPPS